MLLARFLKQVIRIGTLDVIDANGRHHLSVGTLLPEVTIRLHDKRLHQKIVCNPDLYIGEAYMDGSLTIEKGTLAGFAEILMRNLPFALNHPAYKIYDKFCLLNRGWQQFNPHSRSARNVAHHYDLPDHLYDLFLDPDRQYSCAYFTSPDDDLETAQRNKKSHLAAKLRIKADDNILDIGSGWGGLALYLARMGGAQVTGLTLSKEQYAYASQTSKIEHLDDRVRFALRDYRDETGKYDRIVSVGMFEHVGVQHYNEFFAKIRDLLEEDGIFVLHSIGRMNGPSTTSAWIRKYIFPGGYSPALSEVTAAVEKSGLWITDIEILRLHYAETLKEWSRRFEAKRNEIADLLDERFCRMWEYYLALSEAAFRHGDHMVFQLQITKHRDTLPLTRDYIAQGERAISQYKPVDIAPPESVPIGQTPRHENQKEQQSHVH